MENLLKLISNLEKSKNFIFKLNDALNKGIHYANFVLEFIEKSISN